MVVEIETILMPFDDDVQIAFLNLVNMLVLAMTEEQIRNKLPLLCVGEKNISEYFAWGFGAHHLWVNQRYLYSRNNNIVSPYRLLIVRF